MKTIKEGGAPVRWWHGEIARCGVCRGEYELEEGDQNRWGFSTEVRTLVRETLFVVRVKCPSCGSEMTATARVDHILNPAVEVCHDNPR